MPAPTSLEVVLDNTEYSRYEKGRDTITASVIATGGATYTSEVIRVDLVKARRSRDAVVATATITLNGADPQMQDVQFHLPSIVDQDLISLIRFGSYFVRATSITNPTIIGESEDVRLTIMTVDKFKSDYLFGIPLTSTSFKSVKFQPVSITGVEIIEVSKDTAPGFGALSYTYLSGPPVVRQLSWRGGPPVSITAPGTFILRAGNGSSGGACGTSLTGGYIVVRVKSLSLLPTQSIVEDILIDEKTIDDDTLRGYLDKQVSYIENEILYTFLEPTNVVTNRDPTTAQYDYSVGAYTALYADTDYDFIWSPLSYYRSDFGGNWLYIRFPHPQILRIDSLYGAIANTRVLDIDLDWIQPARQGGIVEVVPYNAAVAFAYLGLTIAGGDYGGANIIPNFWNYNLIAGLREVTPDLMMLIGKLAAVDALTALAAAFRPGVGSSSVSRDGVSQSVSYINTQKYGIYTGTISAYKEWLDKEIERYRAKYMGAWKFFTV